MISFPKGQLHCWVETIEWIDYYYYVVDEDGIFLSGGGGGDNDFDYCGQTGEIRLSILSVGGRM